MEACVDNTDYVDADVEIERKIHEIQNSSSRLVSIKERKDECETSLDSVKMIVYAKYQNLWKGMQLMKGALDLEIFRHLIWELQPKTIIELGTYKGGSAVWFADQMKLAGTEGKVVTIDINSDLLDPRAKNHPDIKYLNGDLNKVKEAFPATLLESLPHPWILTEDAHTNLVEVIEYFHGFLREGDYMVFEDTNPHYPSASGMGFIDKFGYEEFGLFKMKEVRHIIEKYDDFYRVDTKYCDMFKFNNSTLMNGVIKRVNPHNKKDDPNQPKIKDNEIQSSE